MISKTDTQSIDTATIRPLAENDIGDYYLLMRALAAHEDCEGQVTATPDELRAIFFANDAHTFTHVLDLDDELIGYVTWYVSFAAWFAKYGIWMCEIYVKPEHRGRGYGRGLVEFLQDIAGDRGYYGVTWWSERTNTETHGFYRHLGATVSEDHFIFGVPAIRRP